MVAMLGEGVGVGTTRDDVAENAQAGDAGDVADHDAELEVHLNQRLLHTLDVCGGALHQSLAVTQIGAQGRDRGGRSEAAPHVHGARRLLLHLRPASVHAGDHRHLSPVGERGWWFDNRLMSPALSIDRAGWSASVS